VVLELRDNPAVTWDVDISFMADMTSSERELQKIGHNSSWYDEQHETDTWQEYQQEHVVLQSAGEDNSLQRSKREKKLVDGPDNFDGWREKKLLRPITEQLKGSCWAHVAAIPLETQLAAHSGGKVEKLSAQELFDCGAEEGQQEIGAAPVHAWDYIREKKHCTTDKEAPELEGPDVKGEDCSYYLSKPNALEKTTDLKVIKFQQRSVEATKYVVSSMAPIAVAAETEKSGLEYFKGDGIFEPPYCGKEPDHAMVLVGYSTDYWIIMNSWPDCGNKGFVKWTRTGLECFLLDRCYVPILKFEEEGALQKREVMDDEDDF